ncbi:MAG: hypothetical protein ACYTEQ_18285 [Planctomycetota bacterium]|jgi:hypothetical protein
MTIPTDQVITEWLLDTQKHEQSLSNLAKMYRKQSKVERDIDLVRKRLDKTTVGLEKTTKKYENSLGDLAKGQAVNIAKGTLMANAFGLVSNKMREALADVNEYSKAERNLTGTIDAARTATQGLIKDLDLMQSKNRLTTLGIKLSDDAFADLLANTQKMADAMGRDLRPALDDITTALARGSARVADNIGIVFTASEAQEKYAEAIGKTVEQLTDAEVKQSTMNIIMSQLNEKASGLPPKIRTISDEWTRLWNRMTNSVTSIASALNQNQTLSTAFAIMTGAATVDEIFNERMVAARRAAFAKGEMPRLEALGEAPVAKLKSRNDELKRRLRDIERSERRPTAVGGGRRTRRRGPSNEFTAGRELRSVADYEKFRASGGAAFEQDEDVQRIAAEMSAQHAAAMKATEGFKSYDSTISRVNRSLEKYNKTLKEGREAQPIFLQQLEQLAPLGDKMAEQIGGMATDALATFTRGIYTSIKAAAAGEKSWSKAFAEMAEAAMDSIAVQSIVQAAFYAASAIGYAVTKQYDSAAEALAAAAAFTAAAVLAGGASAAIASGQGTSGGSGSSTSNTQPAGNQPSFGRTVENQQPINIAVYLGDVDTPSSMRIAMRQVKAQLARAA